MELLLDGHPLDAEAALPEGYAGELSALPPPGAVLALLIGAAPLTPFLRPGDAAWRWRWVAPQAAGAYELRLRASWPDGRYEELRRTLRVVPRKLDQERYAALLDDLQRVGRALVFALRGGASGAAVAPGVEQTLPTPAEELHSLFGAELERLAAAVERLARRPPDRLHPGVVEVGLGRLRDAARLLALRPEREAAAVATPQASYDSYEARLLRRLLDTLGHRLEQLTASGGLPPAMEGQAAIARERLRGLRALPFLAGVPPLSAYRGPTPRLQRDPEYRVVYRVWRRLRRRPQISWDAATMAIPVAELPRLYERWCAARVALALLELPGCSLLAQALLADDGEDRCLRLPEDVPLLVLERPGGALARLRYQPRYPSLTTLPAGSQSAFVALDRHTRVPDLALEIERPGAPLQLLVLDAKYRLDASGGAPADALADAYSYLGAIGTPDGRRAALAVALLYPGHGAAECFASGVATLPLLPGNHVVLNDWLAAYV